MGKLVNDPDLGAFESSTHAQLRVRELGKFEASNSQSSAKHSCPGCPCINGKIEPRKCSTGFSILCIISPAV